MWYKISQNIGGGAIKSAPLLPTASGENVMQVEEPYVPNHKNFEGLNSELRLLLKRMNKTIEDYYEMTMDQQKELWDILVYRPHHIGGSETDSDTDSGVYGDQFTANNNRRQSPYHADPTNTTMEEQLRSSHHDTLNVEPINMQAQSAQQGKAIQTGIGQPAAFASGKGAALFMGDLPANQTLI